VGERKRKRERDQDREKEVAKPSTQTIINLNFMFWVEKAQIDLNQQIQYFCQFSVIFKKLDYIILYNFSIKAPQH